ncbi:hypothetical protein [Streptomyces boninensis]|uniref:hypothetical protein n=1 Tax=Streptomyces boninensis TaxID=2039455 RepID=UPI003B211D3E
MAPRRLAGWAVAAALSLAGCAAPAERVELSPQDTIKAAQQLLTDRCLRDHGLDPPRPGDHQSASADETRQLSDATYGKGRAELSLELPSGHVISQHTDGCLAQAQRRLYGDQQRWFKASTNVGNLKSAAPASDRTTYKQLRAAALDRAQALLTSK